MALMAADPPALVLLDLGLPGEDGFAHRAPAARALALRPGDRHRPRRRGRQGGRPGGRRRRLRHQAVRPARAAGAHQGGAAAARAGRRRRRAAPRPPPRGNATALRRLGARHRGAPPAAIRRARGRADHRRVRPAARRSSRHPGRVLSRDFLLEHDARPRGRRRSTARSTSRSAACAGSSRPTRDDPQIIKSVRGAGYILVPPVDAELTAMTRRRRRPRGAGSTSAASSARCSPPTRRAAAGRRRRHDRAGQPVGRGAARLRASTSSSAWRSTRWCPTRIRPRHAAYREAYRPRPAAAADGHADGAGGRGARTAAR